MEDKSKGKGGLRAEGLCEASRVMFAASDRGSFQPMEIDPVCGFAYSDQE